MLMRERRRELNLRTQRNKEGIGEALFKHGSGKVSLNLREAALLESSLRMTCLIRMYQALRESIWREEEPSCTATNIHRGSMRVLNQL